MTPPPNDLKAWKAEIALANLEQLARIRALMLRFYRAISFADKDWLDICDVIVEREDALSEQDRATKAKLADSLGRSMAGAYSRALHHLYKVTK